VGRSYPETPGNSGWQLSDAEQHPGASWVQLPAQWLRQRDGAANCDPDNLTSGLLMLICGVVRDALTGRLPARAAPVDVAVLQLRGRSRRSGVPTLARALGIGISDRGHPPMRVPIWPHILPSLRA
jgi:hypothetical protein